MAVHSGRLVGVCADDRNQRERMSARQRQHAARVPELAGRVAAGHEGELHHDNGSRASHDQQQPRCSRQTGILASPKRGYNFISHECICSTCVRS